jgi:hypothetical protein
MTGPVISFGDRPSVFVADGDEEVALLRTFVHRFGDRRRDRDDAQH